MTSKWTKGIFIMCMFIFFVSIAGIGVAYLFDKSVVEKVAKTVTTKITEQDDSEETASTTTGSTTTPVTVAGPTNSNTASTGTTTAPATTAPVTAGSGYTMADVQAHGTSNGCWVVYSGSIYALGSYSSSHPGGYVGCGTDITSTMNASHNHSSSAQSLLQSYFIHALLLS